MAANRDGWTIARKLVLMGAFMAALLFAAGGAHPQVPQSGIDARVDLNNDRVIVAMLTLHPGSASGVHWGPEPELGIVVDGEITLVTDKGREVLGPGTVHWLPSLLPHDARNESDRPAKLWVVLFKRCE